MKIIAHRGAKGLATENTRAAFEAGLKSNADYIEFDLRTSKDGIVVVNHDPDLKRLAGKDLNIAESSYADLKKTYVELLRFDEVYKIIGGKKPLLVEIKKDADVEIVIEALKQVTLPAESFIGSFDFAILKAIKKSFPETQLIVIHKWSGVIAGHRARVLGTKYIAMNQRWLWGGFIKSMVSSGYRLIPYTMNDPKKVAKWQPLGLYGIVTDNPGILKDN